MKTDDLGIPRFTNQNLMDMIYRGHASKCHIVLCEGSDDIDKFNIAMHEQGLPELTKYVPINVSQKEFDSVCQNKWLMPDAYKLNESHLWRKIARMADNANEFNRLKEEFYAFRDHGLTDLLNYMFYLVDFMRENDIVWGVGRGSSVASFVLYKISIHKIDSLKYNLDWREFLRD